MRAKEFWIMDYETIINCFVAVFKSHYGKKQEVFVIHDMHPIVTGKQLIIVS